MLMLVFVIISMNRADGMLKARISGFQRLLGETTHLFSSEQIKFTHLFKWGMLETWYQTHIFCDEITHSNQCGQFYIGHLCFLK